MSEKDQMSDTKRGFRKVREGTVVSDKMDKTVVVVVEDRRGALGAKPLGSLPELIEVDLL